MDALELASLIDHTILKPETSVQEVDRVVDEAVEYRFCSVCVAPVFVRRVSEKLKGTGVKTCSVVGFPHGTHKSTIKAIEATSVVKDGADEIDVVAFLPHLIRLDLDAARDELLEIVRAARAVRSDVVIKVIVESAALIWSNPDREEQTIELACQAVRESGCDFIKTSTGYHPAGGAGVLAVSWMKKHAQGAIRIKASGGIRDLQTAREMIAAGADRLGLSASVSIIKELTGIKPDRSTNGY
ncbi:MAG: deoxyribose-phosphate aldolase [Phycisphaerae bacterium]|jgi:deoxyribose-phosphate aldolase|nr:MAG: deoxyribose-phosphate aldolase [Phycisphaerae bacterium]